MHPQGAPVKSTDTTSEAAASPFAALQQVTVPDLWQQEAVSALRAGKDVVVHAPTGAGKTLVFAATDLHADMLVRLLTKAFEVLAESETARNAAAVVALARAAGDAGMVGGQVLDLGLSGHSARRGDVERMHALKTGALIAVSAELGAIVAGAGS